MDTGVSTSADWHVAVDQALHGVPVDSDIVFLLVSYHHAERYPEIVDAIHERLRPRILFGCSGQAVITTGREIEGGPGITLLALSLANAALNLKRISQEDLDAENPLSERLLPTDEVNAWVLLSDPFTIDTENLVTKLAEAYPRIPIMGGMASAFPGGRSAYLFEGDGIAPGGALLLAVGGAWTIHPVVSQGAAPIGESWTITEAEGNTVVGIGGRPALEVLMETLRNLPPDEQARAGRNLLVGLAMDEYADELSQGDFLIRNLLGVDRERGALAINDQARVGQTFQFQLRDAKAASEELKSLLDQAFIETNGGVAGGLLCACNGRGQGMFGAPDHDASAVAERFGPLPLAGLFCNGEIGPVGGKPFVHGFTASLGLFVPVG
ncbi:MAG TPA: hypothetical protein DGL25_01840 [Dehalococcoidia bacterium]|nr:hypothetical protein [Dehalococcoidia bacterium]|tara:strand:+ start:4199 stop:5344 length:1146 start_codon:yes stop_codon:yes gene_type:complete